MDHNIALFMLHKIIEKTPDVTEEDKLERRALEHAIKSLEFQNRYIRKKLDDLKELTGH